MTQCGRLLAVGSMFLVVSATAGCAARSRVAAMPADSAGCDASLEAREAAVDKGRREITVVVGGASVPPGETVRFGVGFTKRTPVVTQTSPSGWIASEVDCASNDLCWLWWTTEQGLSSGSRLTGFSLTFGPQSGWGLQRWAAFLPRCAFGGRLAQATGVRQSRGAVEQMDAADEVRGGQGRRGPRS
jgi:hypothetical protein